jgi:hypothetical protein
LTGSNRVVRPRAFRPKVCFRACHDLIGPLDLGWIETVKGFELLAPATHVDAIIFTYRQREEVSFRPALTSPAR